MTTFEIVFDIALLIAYIAVFVAHIVYLRLFLKKFRFLLYLQDELKGMIDKESEENA